MKILSLVVNNHRSFRDEFFLDLTRPHFKTSRPAEGEVWEDVTYPVALIYGANASGKTSVVRALRYIWSALRHSSGSWLSGDIMQRDPFRLDKASCEGVSLYSIDFVMEGIEWPYLVTNEPIRYHYEFEVSTEGVTYELLQGYFSSKASTIVEREMFDGRTRIRKMARGLGGAVDVAPGELVLSRASKLDRPGLTPLVKSLLEGIDFFQPHESERDGRLTRITRDLHDGSMKLEDLLTLARVADIGIEEVLVEEEEVDPDLRRFLEFVRNRVDSSDEGSHDSRARTEGAGSAHEKMLQRSMRFKHQSINEDEAPLFSLKDESDGTLAWLAIAVSIVKALREGGVLVIDELDTSLHPHLAVEVARIFQDREVNQRGAQLIFTTHETAFLEPQNHLDLDYGQVWLVEKDRNGASSLYSLRDFKDIRKGTNMAKQLLEGRYGAVPRLAPALFSMVLDNDRD